MASCSASGGSCFRNPLKKGAFLLAPAYRLGRIWPSCRLALVLGVSLGAGAARVPATEVPSKVLFYPGTGCAEAAVKAIDSAKWFIDIRSHNGFSDRMVKALVAARKRGVDVEVLFDGMQKPERMAAAETLFKVGIKSYVDAKGGGQDGIIIIDEGQVLTGPFDFTREPDECISENLLIITDTAITGKYLENWKAHLQRSTPFGPKRKG